jgi:hypothetical protein
VLLSDQATGSSGDGDLWVPKIPFRLQISLFVRAMRFGSSHGLRL